MHLVAERLGELPLEIGEPSYHEFLEKYEEFEEYTSFLRTFYEELTTVTPGEPAVPFTLPDPDGNLVSMSDFSGKYVLLDFWASWCIPCLNEFPDMKRIYENTSREEFEIVAISTEEDSLVWRQALEKFDNPWVQVYGGNGFEQETFREYKGGGIPFYILINPEGNIERYNDIRATYNLESVLDSLFTHNPPD
ncbi:MAG: TlpA disulfide reductase family protein [Balneolaceae bacterium]